MSDDVEFGDIEPEDAWDRNDTFLEQVGNLFLRLDALDQQHHSEHRFRPVLDEIEQRLRRWRNTSLTDREQLRVTQLIEDLAFLRDRDERGDYDRG